MILALMCCACGKKADPGLPMPIVPEAPSRFQAVARSEGIFILWRAPVQNVNTTPLVDLAGFKILRATEPLDAFCPKCPKNFSQLADIDYKGDRGKTPDKQQYYYQDTARAAGMAYVYHMLAYNDRDKDGKQTKNLVVFWDQPPALPAGFKAVRKGKALQLSWQPVTALEDGSPLEGFAGYTIYRTLRQGIYEEAPVNSEPVQEPLYEDVPEKIDETYFYTVRAVRMVKDTMVESGPSSELQVAYMDITPSGVPTGLVAVPRHGGIELKWIGALQADITGYNIYRRGDGGFVRLNSQLITKTSWIDTSAQEGKSYVYGITSVDASARANESPMSETSSVTFTLQ